MAAEERKVEIWAVEADQRFALAAENWKPQPWRWEVETVHYFQASYAAFYWTAWIWSRVWAWNFARRERLLSKPIEDRVKAWQQRDELLTAIDATLPSFYPHDPAVDPIRRAANKIRAEGEGQ